MNKLFNFVKRNARKAQAVAVGLGTSGLALAQEASTVFDPTTHVTAVKSTIPGALAIGGAVFLVILAIKSTKWGRRAL